MTGATRRSGKQNVYIIDLGTGTDSNLLPLASGLLASHSRSISEIRDEYDIHIRFLRSDPYDMLRGLSEPAVVAFSCYIWNIRVSLQFARLIKDAQPECLVVLGGPQVPKRPERIRAFLGSYPFIDALVLGEGEYAFADLLLTRAARRDLFDVKGLAVREPDRELEILVTGLQPRVDLRSLSSPFLDGTFDRLLEQYRPQVGGAIWETNRGCPFACTFCDWGGADVNKITRYDLERLGGEIEWMGKQGIGYVFTADANFGILFERDLQIAQWVAAARQRFGSPDAFVVNWTKNSHERIVMLADTLRRGGVSCSVTLSVQSQDPSVLAAIKRQNLPRDDQRSLKREFHDRNIPTYTELILGLPEETYRSFVDGLEQLMTPRLADCLIIYPALLLENTEMATPEYRERHGLQTRFTSVGFPRRRFAEIEEGDQEIVVATKTLPLDDWKHAYVVGYATVALYYYRLAFFSMTYLREHFAMPCTAFVEFLVTEIATAPHQYPHVERALAHLARQQESVLNNGSEVSEVDGVPGVSLSPAEAFLALCSMDYDDFYRELKRLVLRLAEMRGWTIPDAVLDDVLCYERIRVAIWPAPRETVYRFGTNVPRYFEALTSGLRPLPLTADPCVVEVTGPSVNAQSFAEYSRRRVRRMMVQLSDVRVSR